jgi:hypothetical protein
MILKDCASNHIPAEERCTIRMESILHKEFSSLEEFVDKCVNFENC